MSGVKVILRDTEEGLRSYLGDMPLESVDRVIPTLKHFGMQTSYGSSVDTETLVGTFRFGGEDQTYFEVSFETV